MTTLTERMNTQVGEVSGAHVMKRTNIGFAAYDTLCLICSDMNIDLASVDDSDFDSCAIVLEQLVHAANQNADGDCGSFSVWFD